MGHPANLWWLAVLLALTQSQRIEAQGLFWKGDPSLLSDLTIWRGSRGESLSLINHGGHPLAIVLLGGIRNRPRRSGMKSNGWEFICDQLLAVNLTC